MQNTKIPTLHFQDSLPRLPIRTFTFPAQSHPPRHLRHPHAHGQCTWLKTTLRKKRIAEESEGFEPKRLLAASFALCALLPILVHIQLPDSPPFLLLCIPLSLLVLQLSSRIQQSATVKAPHQPLFDFLGSAFHSHRASADDVCSLLPFHPTNSTVAKRTSLHPFALYTILFEQLAIQTIDSTHVFSLCHRSSRDPS
jgi:hypothetical protein